MSDFFLASIWYPVCHYSPSFSQVTADLLFVSEFYAYAEVGYLKCPHPLNIDGNIWWDSHWFLGGFGTIGSR